MKNDRQTATWMSRCSLLALLLVVSARGADAACTPTLTPNTGETVTCDTTGPNPSPRVEALPGSTGVTVNVLSGAQIEAINANAILIRGQSEANNAGTLSVSGATFDGIRTDGTSNTVVNSGVITTQDAQSEGFYTEGGSQHLDERRERVDHHKRPVFAWHVLLQQCQRQPRDQ